MIIEFHDRSLDAILALKQCTMDCLEANMNNTNESCEEPSTKRRLRSHKNTEEFILDLGAVTQQSKEEHNSDTTAQMSSLTLLRQLLPTNIAVKTKTRELLQDVLAWQILPSDSPAEPSMIYGAVHLSRLIVKLPDFINATTMPDEKLKLLLQYLDSFIE